MALSSPLPAGSIARQLATPFICCDEAAGAGHDSWRSVGARLMPYYEILAGLIVSLIVSLAPGLKLS
jgi:hypothetical protein